MRRLYLLHLLALVVSGTAFAQNPGDFRSATTGPWNQAATWQTFNGSIWVAAGAFPTSADGVITISDQTVVNIPSGATITADQIEYENNLGGSTGTLVVDAGGTLAVVNGLGDDIRILNDFTTLGLLQVSGTLTLATGATIVDDDYGNLGIGASPVTSDTYKILNGGMHVHTTGSGVSPVPAADYQDGSTCRIDAGAAGTPAIDPGVSFYNFTWNGVAQAALINLAGNLVTVRNDLIINSTGPALPSAGFTLQLASTSGYSLTVGRDLTIQGNARVQFGTTATPVVINVGRDFNIASTSAQANAIIISATGTTTLNITGDFNKSNAAALNLLPGTSGATTVNLLGNFSLTGGTLTKATTGTGTAIFNFNGSSTRTFTNTTVNGLTGPVAFNVAVGKVLDLQTYAITGTGAFTLRAGATIRVGSPDGLNKAAANLGNIRTSGLRTYTANGNIVYNGTVAQNLGNEWSSVDGGAIVGVAVNLEINNSSGGGVTNNVAGSTNVVGNLTLTNGALKIGAANELNIKSNFTATSGTIGGDPTASLIFSGSGSVSGNLVFAPGFQNLNILQIDRSGDVVLGSPLTLATGGSLKFTATGNLVISGQTLTANGDITQSASGGISSTLNTTNLNIGGSGVLSSLPIAASSLFNNISLSRTGGASYSWNANATISGTFDLASGAFTHSSGLTMGTGSTFKRSSGTTYSGSTPNATTRYSVNYTGTLTTSNEMPTTALNRLENLTIGGDVTLNKAITINGDLNINTGKLAASTFNITMLGATFAVNGGTFEQSSSNGVTFSRVGQTSLSGSTINDVQFGNFTISGATTTVLAPNAANINVSNTWTNNGVFNPGTGTVTFNGTTQSINANGQPFYNLETANGTKTLTGALVINGGLDINTGSTLVAGSNTISIAGLWDNNGTFTPGTGTVIFNGNSQTIANNGQAFNAVTFATGGTKTLAANLEADGALTINSGVTLDVSASNYNLLAGAAFTNNGTFTPRQGTVTFDGGLPQTVSGSTNTQFYNITQTNATSVSISSAQSLVNALTLSAGTFNSNGNFTLISTASGDARINDLTSGGTIGNSSMIIQRYLPNTAGLSVARYMSSPASNAMMSQWKDDFPITGPISDHSTVAEWAGQGISPYPFNETGNSIQIYDETKTPTTSLNDRYRGYPTTGTIATTPLVPGVGYNVRPRVTAAITPEVVGRPNFGPVSVSVVASGVTANDGWNLVGNPYPSPINWNNVSRPAGVAAQIALTDNTNNIGTGAGNFIYYTAGGTGIPVTYTGTIAQGQGFWVRKTTVGSTTLTFQEDDKQATSTPPFVRQAEEDILRINVTGNLKSDELVVLFREDAQDIAEAEFDATKMDNPAGNINFYTMSSDNAQLAINTMGALSCSREIPLVLKGVTSGSHIMTFSQLETFGDGIDIRLFDAVTGGYFVATEANAQYAFTVDAADPKTFGADRFSVFVGYKTLDLSLALQAADGCNGSDAQVKVLAPQKGVSYYATIDGTTVSDKFIATGAELAITIPAANLGDGENKIVIKAQNGPCPEMPLAQFATVKKNGIPTISNVVNAEKCGESSVDLKASGAPDGGSYRWYLTEDATDAIAGATNSSYTTPTIAKTKTYFVSAVSALGCEGARVPVTATISYVDQATITEQNGLLVSNSESGNQWYLNGKEINGATNKTYKPTQSGEYTLIVTTGVCSSETTQSYAVTGDIDGDNVKGYVLYPNPSTGLVHVQVATTNEVRVSVLNGVGTEITRGDLKQEGNLRVGQFDITKQAAGVYLVVIKNNKETVTRKIIKN